MSDIKDCLNHFINAYYSKRESRAKKMPYILYKKIKKILSENIRENDDKKNMIKRFLGKRKISRLEFWIEIYHG